MTTTLTDTQRKSIEEMLARTDICTGIGRGSLDDGTVEACSLAAINLALTGKLHDRVPDCMSPVIGRWIIAVQDRMPGEIRNGKAWRTLLPLAAGTGREHESERRNLILEWMWDGLEPLADLVPESVRPAWRKMCEKRTAESAREARAAAATYDAADAAAYDAAAYAAAAYAAADAADAAAYAAAAATTYAAADAGNSRLAYWQSLDPAGLLAALIAVGEMDEPIPYEVVGP